MSNNIHLYVEMYRIIKPASAEYASCLPRMQHEVEECTSRVTFVSQEAWLDWAGAALRIMPPQGGVLAAT